MAETLFRALKTRRGDQLSDHALREVVGAKVVETAGKFKSKWLSREQIEAVKGFGRRFRMTMRSGVIHRNIYNTEDADHGYTYSPSYLIGEIEDITYGRHGGKRDGSLHLR